MHIYLDTNVFISLFQEEIGFKFRGLNIEARDFFERAAKRGDTICISSLFLDEVKKITFMDKKSIFEELEKKELLFKLVKDPNYDEILFFKRLGIHSPDCIHASIAHKNCECIVTFNTKDFVPAKKFISVFSPADL
jgi:predicted nucleic acid-binding protein